VEVEKVEVPAAVAVAVWLAVIYLLLVVVVFLGVVAYQLETVAVWLAGVLLEVAVGIAHDNSFATSFEAAGEILVDNATLGHANDALCSHLSILNVLFDEKMEHHYSIPNLSDSSVSDTSVLPTDATTSHRRRRGPRLNQGQRRHPY
jgi:hypothetical protein